MRQMANPPLSVVFDLDGTLVDTAPDLAAAMNAVLAEDGLPPLPLEAVRAMVGRGAGALIARGFTEHGRSLDERRREALVERFIAHYHSAIAAYSHPFPGARPAVDALRRAGCQLGICTNKHIGLTTHLLDAIDFRAPFGSVRGADSQPYRKPDPRHLLDVITDLGGIPERSVLIGDSETDAKTAQAAGVPVILVTFGYTEVPVEDLGADVLIGHFDELHGALQRLWPEFA